jgi:hypothetical protein
MNLFYNKKEVAHLIFPESSPEVEFYMETMRIALFIFERFPERRTPQTMILIDSLSALIDRMRAEDIEHENSIRL